MSKQRLDERLLERQWAARETPHGEFVYRKEGTYGWFSNEAAWYHEADIAANVVEQQYPTELMPKRSILSSSLAQKPPMSQGEE